MMPMTYVNGSLVGLMLALVLVGLVSWAVVTMVRTGNRPTVPPSPEQVLRDRLARGEIDAEQYRTSLDLLNSPAGERNGTGR